MDCNAQTSYLSFQFWRYFIRIDDVIRHCIPFIVCDYCIVVGLFEDYSCFKTCSFMVYFCCQKHCEVIHLSSGIDYRRLGE